MYARAGEHARGAAMFRHQRMFAEAEAFEKRHAVVAQQSVDGRLLAQLSAHMQVGEPQGMLHA